MHLVSLEVLTEFYHLVVYRVCTDRETLVLLRLGAVLKQLIYILLPFLKESF